MPSSAVGGYCSVMVQAVTSLASQVPQYIGLRMNADEYLGLPDDGFRYQVISGVVVMSPRINRLSLNSAGRSATSWSNRPWRGRFPMWMYGSRLIWCTGLICR